MNVREVGQTLAAAPVRTGIGCAFAFAISRQLLFGGSHAAIWFGIYGSWAVALVALYVMSRAPDDDDADTEDDDSKNAAPAEDSHV
jgi:hypothetical protein